MHLVLPVMGEGKDDWHCPRTVEISGSKRDDGFTITKLSQIPESEPVAQEGGEDRDKFKHTHDIEDDHEYRLPDDTEMTEANDDPADELLKFEDDRNTKEAQEDMERNKYTNDIDEDHTLRLPNDMEMTANENEPDFSRDLAVILKKDAHKQEPGEGRLLDLVEKTRAEQRDSRLKDDKLYVGTLHSLESHNDSFLVEMIDAQVHLATPLCCTNTMG